MKTRVSVEVFGEKIDRGTIDQKTYHVDEATAARNMQRVLLKLIRIVEVAHGVIFLKVMQ